MIATGRGRAGSIFARYNINKKRKLNEVAKDTNPESIEQTNLKATVTTLKQSLRTANDEIETLKKNQRK